MSVSSRAWLRRQLQVPRVVDLGAEGRAEVRTTTDAELRGAGGLMGATVLDAVNAGVSQAGDLQDPKNLLDWLVPHFERRGLSLVERCVRLEPPGRSLALLSMNARMAIVRRWLEMNLDLQAIGASLGVSWGKALQLLRDAERLVRDVRGARNS